MGEVRENPLVVEATTVEGREELLENLHSQIEQCESALNEYLAQKKKQFPRFYFVSNQALLDILSNGNNPHIEEADGRKLNSAVGMYSKTETEYTPFPDKVNNGRFVCEGAVEFWLGELESMMRKVLKCILENARQTAELWDIQGEKSREV